MIYIYDILLNFCDSNLIYDFFEWDKQDNIENVKRIKLFHISKDNLINLYKDDIKIGQNILDRINKTCEIYDNRKIKVIDYCCLFSDGEKVIAIEFDKNGNSIFKSNLLLDEEDEISEIANNLELTELEYKKNNKKISNRFLTRTECLIKKYLIKEIENSYKNHEYEKLNYLYQEYYEKDCINNYKRMKEELIESVNNIVDSRHKELFNLLRLTKKKNKYSV